MYKWGEMIMLFIFEVVWLKFGDLLYKVNSFWPGLLLFLYWEQALIPKSVYHSVFPCHHITKKINPPAKIHNWVPPLICMRLSSNISKYRGQETFAKQNCPRLIARSRFLISSFGNFLVLNDNVLCLVLEISFLMIMSYV